MNWIQLAPVAIKLLAWVIEWLEKKVEATHEKMEDTKRTPLLVERLRARLRPYRARGLSEPWGSRLRP